MAIYYTNTERNFSETAKLEGTMGRRSSPRNNNHFVFEIKKGEETIQHDLEKIHTLYFIWKRYKLFTIATALMLMFYLYFSPIVAILLYLSIEAAVYYVKPFETIRKAQQYTTGIRYLALAIFIYAGFNLFGGLEDVYNSLRLTQTLLYGTLIVFSLFYFHGLIHKYDKVYRLLKSEDDDITDTGVYMWRA